MIGTIDAIAKLAEQGRIINETRLRVLCREGRVEGAELIAGRWILPDDFVIGPPKKKEDKK